MPDIKEPHPWIGRDVMCIDDRPWPNNQHEIELKLYHIYRVANASAIGIYLEGLRLGYNEDRFVDVSNWPVEMRELNRT